MEQFVATPELHSDDAIEGDPLPPGQVWAITPAVADTGPGLCRIEVTAGPGSSVRILNQPTPPPFRESVKVGQQNLYAHAKELVGNRDPRSHEFTLQLRAMDSDKTGSGIGLPVLVAMVGSLLERNTRGGTIIVGSLNLGGSIERIPNPVAVAELAVDKQAATLLMPVSSRRALNDLPDELWTKVNDRVLSRSGGCRIQELGGIGLVSAKPNGFRDKPISERIQRNPQTTSGHSDGAWRTIFSVS